MPFILNTTQYIDTAHARGLILLMLTNTQYTAYTLHMQYFRGRYQSYAVSIPVFLLYWQDPCNV